MHRLFRTPGTEGNSPEVQARKSGVKAPDTTHEYRQWRDMSWDEKYGHR